MKQLLLLLFLLICSCSKQETNVSVVLENKSINPEVIKSLEEYEKALLSWYLFAYGNACEANSLKVKCEILDILSIEDECNPEHLNNLLQWFSTDMLAVYKLNNCPNMVANSSIQNTFDKIIINKKDDTLSIDYIIKGINNSQEKSWNMEQTESYLIEGNTLVKIKPNE